MGVSSIEDGLLGRFLFAFGQEGVVPRRISSAFSLSSYVKDSSQALQEEIRKAISLFAVDSDEAIKIRIEDEAEARLCKLLTQFDQRRRDVKSTFAKALLARSCEKAERVAGVLAVWDCPALPVMTIEHVAWAEALLIASDEALMRFSVEYMHGGECQANAQRILTLLPRVLSGELKPQKKHEGGMIGQGLAPYSMMLRSSKLDKRSFSEALEYLYDLCEVQTIEVTSKHPNGRTEKTRGLVRM